MTICTNLADRSCRHGDRGRLLGGDVTVRRLPGLEHVNSWVQAMPRAVRYFRRLD